MKKPALVIALLLSTVATGVVSAAANANAPGAQSQAAQEPRATQPTRLAEGFGENFWGREHHGERHGHHERHSEDDDDDDDRGGRKHGRNGGANRQADPNAANAPVPDNGVFNGKTRPKVEVQ
jgi:hypothetical protein